ncbi:GTP binding protein [Schizosaccharomyces japonicus yFS275]|uniref:Obg-like ATPase 1 n=1 Tax=Schizosaccharomyces japonicus (strain yFS275 / FY16936) TaxID=402676 RepID=B6K7Z9_SCHJY|nr:GTP binding protein [Schizosaccharomyces japonicus yFS275]EEB09653.1 GTP binding protein [Schizosaccharomyces japonicus yFS275]
MPPKKVVQETKVQWGRPGNNLKAGIVGMPNVGKSTFFQAITKSVLGNPANYPYATIEPEEAKVAVPDERFDYLTELYKPVRIVPAFLTVIDIAGLTKGAHTGAGLGNSFLSNVRAVDAIFQMVRAFDDAEIVHVEGDVNPVRDLSIILEELLIKDAEFVTKHLEGLKKITSRGANTLEMKMKKEEQATTERVLEHLTVTKQPIRKGNWTNKEIEFINTLLLLTAKPVIYLVNMSERDYLRQKNKYLPKIKAWIDENSPGDILIPVSVAFEERLTRMPEEEAQEECKRLNTKSMLPKIIITGYNALKLINYFTVGPEEVRAWTIRDGTKAPQAAGVIHTDFEKAFVCGEIMHYDDLVEYKSENACRSAGKYMTKGKDYVMVSGDVAHWKAGKR